jgi:hypothetical protein
VKFLFEMANLHKQYSNLPVNLYFTGNGYRNIKNHNCLRVKVQQDKSNSMHPENLSSIMFMTGDNWDILNYRKVGKFKISNSDLNTIIDYIKDNWDMIVKHWIGELPDRDFLINLPPVK